MMTRGISTEDGEFIQNQLTSVVNPRTNQPEFVDPICYLRHSKMNESYPQNGGGLQVYNIYEVSLYVARSLAPEFLSLLHFPVWTVGGNSFSLCRCHGQNPSPGENAVSRCYNSLRLAIPEICTKDGSKKHNIFQSYYFKRDFWKNANKPNLQKSPATLQKKKTL